MKIINKPFDLPCYFSI